eukprot:scaffold30497_cov171-Skeletonema_menzelii.AAC.4
MECFAEYDVTVEENLENCRREVVEVEDPSSRPIEFKSAAADGGGSLLVLIEPYVDGGDISDIM